MSAKRQVGVKRTGNNNYMVITQYKGQMGGSTVIPNLLLQRYTCDSSQLHPDLGRCFVQLHPDGETREFVEKSKRKSSSICLQMLYSFVQLLLGLFLSRTAINGYGLLRGEVGGGGGGGGGVGGGWGGVGGGGK